jgi:hypothetical protein
MQSIENMHGVWLAYAPNIGPSGIGPDNPLHFCLWDRSISSRVRPSSARTCS